VHLHTSKLFVPASELVCNACASARLHSLHVYVNMDASYPGQVSELPLSYPGVQFMGMAGGSSTKPHLLLLVVLSALGNNSSNSD